MWNVWQYKDTTSGATSCYYLEALEPSVPVLQRRLETIACVNRVVITDSATASR
jgi:hypothetical protein